MCRLIVSLLAPGETGQYIGFKLHPDLEPIIKDPKVFAKLKLIMMVLLTKPKYGYPLYELFADSYSRGQRTLRIPTEILREYLGISADKYSVFKDSKTRILKRSIESINKASDYFVKYETYRTGKTVEGVLFRLKRLAEDNADQHARPTGEIARRHKETQEKIQLEVNQLTNDFWGYQLGLIEPVLERMSSEDRSELDRKFILNNPMWAKKFQEVGLKSPMTRSAFYKFAINELLNDEQKDIVAYAKTREVSVEALNLLQVLL